MRSPPSSAGLFVSPSSSPSDLIGTDREGEVLSLFTAAQKVTLLNQNLRDVINRHHDSFFDNFGRQVQLLKSRSQAFEDAHITVYDKVLLLLTENGNRLENHAAIAWYCKEYLGFNFNDPVKALEQSLEWTPAFSQALFQAATHGPTHVNADDMTHLRHRANAHPEPAEEDPKLKHLWSVYIKARRDYLALADKRDFGTLEAAKFLRDTAENGVQFLEHRYPSDPKLTELKNTYSMAKSVVVELNGGKKRKFDRTIDHDPRHHKRMTHSSLSAEHNRINSARRLQEKNMDNTRSRGRGPSGIPYGYTRPVDSYHPA